MFTVVRRRDIRPFNTQTDLFSLLLPRRWSSARFPFSYYTDRVISPLIIGGILVWSISEITSYCKSLFTVSFHFKRGVNSRAFFSPNSVDPPIFKSPSRDDPIKAAKETGNIFVQIRNHNHLWKQKCKHSKVNWQMWMPLLISRK